jgi:hypothetical protein
VRTKRASHEAGRSPVERIVARVDERDPGAAE